MQLKNTTIFSIIGSVVIFALFVLQYFEVDTIKKLSSRLNSIEKSPMSIEDQSPKSHDQLIKTAVANVSPSVVSIVVSKVVPNFQIIYVNPFKDDPNLSELNIKIPSYQKEKGASLKKVGAGSGFLISHDGYIITSRHVVDDSNAKYTVQLYDNTQKAAKVVYQDPTYDIAVIKIEGNYDTIAKLGDSTSLSLGQTVIAIGNDLGEYSNSVSVGIVSGLNRTIQASDYVTGNSEELKGVIQTDTPINLGSSGGPLIDLDSNVIGINVASVANSSNIAFSIPINMAKDIVKKVIK